VIRAIALALTNSLEELPQLLGINVVIPSEQIAEANIGSTTPLSSQASAGLKPSGTAPTRPAAATSASSLSSAAAAGSSAMLSSLGQAFGAFPNMSQVPPSVIKEHILSAQSTGDTKRWEILGMPSGFGQQAHISMEQRQRLLQRVQEVFELRSRFSAQGSFVFRMAEVVISALAAVIHLNSGPEFHGEALACGRRACMEAESMGR
jgi:hypothetical protein